MGEYCFYLRKSRVDIEAERAGEDTLARHEEILNLTANRLNIAVSKVYREVVSGETIAARPIMQQLLTDVENGLWSGVFVVEIERLARGDTLDQGIVAQVFKYSNTQIITPSKTYSPWRDEDEEYFEFNLFMSRREYKKINQRMNAGRVSSARQGMYVGSRLPFGYNKEKLKGKGYKLVINEEQADTVKQIYKWRADNQLSYEKIAKKLNELNIKPFYAEKWTQVMVRSVLSNDVYIGKIHWNKRKTIKTIKNGHVIASRPLNYSNDCIVADGMHEPIIDMKTWEKVQSMRSIKRVPQTTIQNPLAGIMVCGKCGQKMQRKVCRYKDKVTIMLFCVNHECDNIGANLELVEQKLLESLEIYLKNYKIDFENRTRKDNQEIVLTQKSIDSIVREVEKEKKKLEIICENLESGVYTASIFKERSKKITANIAELEKKLAQQREALEQARNLILKAGEIIPKIETVMEVYKSTNDIEEKNLLLKSILEKVEYLKFKRVRRLNIANFELKLFPRIPP